MVAILLGLHPLFNILLFLTLKDMQQLAYLDSINAYQSIL
jgi:hypothetical protein